MSSNAAIPANNGAVLHISQIIATVMTSAAESEIGAMCIIARKAVPPHPNNLAAHAVVTNNVQPRRKKAMDMSIHWLRYCDTQGQFRYYWKPGTMNLGDYWTKHNPSAHHKNFRSSVLTPMTNLMDFRSRHMASTERLKAQKKTQLTNMNQLNTFKKMLDSC